jgi:hypothetical protein
VDGPLEIVGAAESATEGFWALQTRGAKTNEMRSTMTDFIMEDSESHGQTERLPALARKFPIRP